MLGQVSLRPVNHPEKKPSLSKPASSAFWVDAPDIADAAALAGEEPFAELPTRGSALEPADAVADLRAEVDRVVSGESAS